MHVQETFLYISPPSLNDYDVKHPNFTCYGGRFAKLRYGPLESNSKKFETARIHYFSDVFVAFAVVGYISSQMNILSDY